MQVCSTSPDSDALRLGLADCLLYVECVILPISVDDAANFSRYQRERRFSFFFALPFAFSFVYLRVGLDAYVLKDL